MVWSGNLACVSSATRLPSTDRGRRSRRGHVERARSQARPANTAPALPKACRTGYHPACPSVREILPRQSEDGFDLMGPQESRRWKLHIRPRVAGAPGQGRSDAFVWYVRKLTQRYFPRKASTGVGNIRDLFLVSYIGADNRDRTDNLLIRIRPATRYGPLARRRRSIAIASSRSVWTRSSSRSPGRAQARACRTASSSVAA